MDPYLPAWRLAELTASGEIGCLELLDFYLDRVHRLNPRLNAIVLQDTARARAASSGVRISPFTITGRDVACLTCRTNAQSAVPV